MHLFKEVTAEYCKYCIICGLISRSKCKLATEDAKRVNEMQKSFLKKFHILTWPLYHREFHNSFQSELPTNRSLESLVLLSLRAVLSTSRRKKVFFYFFAHEKGLGHMFQK